MLTRKLPLKLDISAGQSQEQDSDEDNDDISIEEPAVSKAQTLREAGLMMTYFKYVILLDTRVPEFMKREIKQARFKSFFERLTEVRKVKRGKKKPPEENYDVGADDEVLMCPSTVGEEVKDALKMYFQRAAKNNVKRKRVQSDL